MAALYPTGPAPGHTPRAGTRSSAKIFNADFGARTRQLRQNYQAAPNSYFDELEALVRQGAARESGILKICNYLWYLESGESKGILK
jgi:hypothetical protein